MSHTLPQSIAASLRKEPETAVLGALGVAVVAFHRGFPALAWTEFAAVPPELRWQHAASEYVRSGIKTDRTTVLDEVRRLVADDPESVDARNWTDILGAVFGAGDEELSREIFAVLDREVGDGTDVDESVVVNRDWIRPWVAASADSPERDPPSRPVTCRSRSWTTAIPAGRVHRRTSATTCRAWPRWDTWCVTRT